jgi:hypothetical protein
MFRPSLLVLPLAVAVFLCGVASAQAAIWTASVDDAANDTSDFRADHDLRKATFRYDDAANRIEASAQLGAVAAAGDKTILILRFATLVDGNTNCAGRAAGLLTELGPGGQSVWAAASATGQSEGQGPATRADSGTTITLAAEVPLLAQIRPGCVWAQVVGGDPQNPTRIDITEPLTILTNTTPSPPPPPPPVVQPRPAALSLSVQGVRSVKRNRWLRTKATIVNTGGQAATGVRLALKRPRGVSVRISGARRGRTTLGLKGALAAGQRKVVSVRLRIGRRAKRASKVRFTATGAGGLSATQTVALRIGR